MSRQYEPCALCGEETLVYATSIHHIIPKFLKPKYNLVIPLCYPCHIKIHNNLNGLGGEVSLKLADTIVALENQK